VLTELGEKQCTHPFSTLSNRKQKDIIAAEFGKDTPAGDGNSLFTGRPFRV